MDIDTAKAMLALLLGKHWPLFGSFHQFLDVSIQSCSVAKLLGPVVQSIVSLTSSLRGQLVKCFATL